MLREVPLFFNCFLHSTSLSPDVETSDLFSPRIFFTLLLCNSIFYLPVSMMIRAGILSDTHLVRPDSRFKKQVRHCFQGCDVIIHAGDMTSPSVLDIFQGIQVVAVHGNMCAEQTRIRYPSRQLFTLGQFTIGLTHGAGLGLDIENALFDIFPEADCMIYGHTHRASIQRYAEILMVNPGSFQATGRYGAPGTYAILEAGDTLQASIHQIPQLP